MENFTYKNINGRNEFLGIINQATELGAELVNVGVIVNAEEVVSFELKKNYTPEELNKFLRMLDYMYDNHDPVGYMWGTAWFTNDIYAVRVWLDSSKKQVWKLYDQRLTPLTELQRKQLVEIENFQLFEYGPVY